MDVDGRLRQFWNDLLPDFPHAINILKLEDPDERACSMLLRTLLTVCKGILQERNQLRCDSLKTAAGKVQHDLPVEVSPQCSPSRLSDDVTILDVTCFDTSAVDERPPRVLVPETCCSVTTPVRQPPCVPDTEPCTEASPLVYRRSQRRQADVRVTTHTSSPPAAADQDQEDSPLLLRAAVCADVAAVAPEAGWQRKQLTVGVDHQPKQDRSGGDRANKKRTPRRALQYSPNSNARKLSPKKRRVSSGSARKVEAKDRQEGHYDRVAAGKSAESARRALVVPETCASGISTIRVKVKPEVLSVGSESRMITGASKSTTQGAGGVAAITDCDIVSEVAGGSLLPCADDTAYYRALFRSPGQQQARRPLFKYQSSPVRNKSDRGKLPGWSCDLCRRWYKDHDLSESQQRAHMERCSRHRDRNEPQPDTPPGFWDPMAFTMDRTQCDTE